MDQRAGFPAQSAAVAMVVTTPFNAVWFGGDPSASDSPADNDYLVRWSVDHVTVLVVGFHSPD